MECVTILFQRKRKIPTGLLELFTATKRNFYLKFLYGKCGEIPESTILERFEHYFFVLGAQIKYFYASV